MKAFADVNLPAFLRRDQRAGEREAEIRGSIRVFRRIIFLIVLRRRILQPGEGGRVMWGVGEIVFLEIGDKRRSIWIERNKGRGRARWSWEVYARAGAR